MANKFISGSKPNLFSKIMTPILRANQISESKKLAKYGLLEQDALYVSPAVQKALDRLPHDIAVARERRLYRAADLSLKKKEVPVELQIDPEEDYFQDLIKLAQAEIDERNKLNDY